MQLLDKKNSEKLEQAMLSRIPTILSPSSSAKTIFNKTSFFEWLESHNPDPRTFSFFKGGSLKIYPDRVHTGYFMSNITPLISNKAIANALQDGASIQFRCIHNVHKKITQLQRALIKKLHCFVSINLYYSPSQTNAFNQHYDPYDFLILQLSGEKTWILGKDKKQKIQLKTGQLMYVPAYTYHEVSTRKSDSLHLTIALHRLTMPDLIETLYPQSPYHLPCRGGQFDTKSIQEELNELSQKISGLDSEQLTDLILKTWHRKITQCFYDSTLTGETDPILDSLKVDEGTWVLEQMQRTLNPKSKSQ